ncbi:ABC transporter permease [Aestuariispira insulae]|uniref:Peptide/nickel transport system permease protein n=1 Tax=Aestuariispira insulae TaxID=1461337 RepID=A0A3D9HI52_9PROT|nr:ABC transporter permease [Aestuariispira insulae]RED49199.1 peptide/nickel transport system permease protein [Aestuariispira insulae]
MAAFLARRLAQSGLILFIVIFLTYWLMGLMPGDPIDLMVQSNPDLTPADAARLKALYGLDQPIITRFWNWLTQALQGDFGYSRLFGQPVWEVLWPRLVNTLILMLPVVLLSIVIAVPLGLLAARKAYGWFDYTVNLASFAGISVPPFWFAILMIIGFAVTLNWLPASAAPPGDAGLMDHLRHLILPVATLTILNVGTYLRFMRAASLQTLRQDYVRTALAKGVSETRLLTHHVLRNALLPLVTIIALSFGSLFSGTLIIETIFAWPGMGKTIYDSVLGNDYNLAMVGFLLATATTLLGNILADLCYGLLDPRIELEEVKLGG